MTTTGEIFYSFTDCGSIQKHNFAIHLLSYNVGNRSERSSLIATEQETTLNLHFSNFLFPRLIILLETTQQIVFKARDLSLTREPHKIVRQQTETKEQYSFKLKHVGRQMTEKCFLNILLLQQKLFCPSHPIFKAAIPLQMSLSHSYT